MTGTSDPSHLNGQFAEEYAVRHARPSALFDEMADQGGQWRPHWQGFLRALGNLGLPELTRRWQEARDLIRENGITYNVYGDPRGTDRPWELDALPLLLSPQDWSHLEAGLAQRARLLELILADIYGPQRLLRDGVLPAELVFSHPGFLRPCHGIRSPRSLLLYAADLGRSPDGQFWVLADRTQAPSGAGYALENRLVLSRMLPDLFRDCQVQRLSLFFRTLRETLSAVAPHNRDNPRIVLLTPGPYNETYFEHAYLARYLGYTLAEGADLTVRDERVYLKLLGGLSPVDVIMRRLDDSYCDPLELRGDSLLGVPGLVQAARAGNVAVANPLGSGCVETAALMGFLPALCRHLLGEELRLPSVASWWCADPVARQHVLANLHRLVIKPAYAALRREPVFGSRLTPEMRQSLADQINARPRDFVAQEQMELSTVPVVTAEHLQPRRLVLRCQLAASGTTSGNFAVMPGGLSRVSASRDTLVVSLQRGGGSKDTWVLSTGPVTQFSLLRPEHQPIELSRGGGDLPSRVADDLFWLGRYAERSEGLVRLLRGILGRWTEKSSPGESPELPTLLRALAQFGVGAERAISTPLGGEQDILALIFDAQRPTSLRTTLASLRRVAARVRDRISIDTWRLINSLDLDAARVQAPQAETVAYHALAAYDAAPTLSDVLDLLNRLVLTLTAFGGMVNESMTRGHGWRFLDMGRRLERSIDTLGLLRDTLVWPGAHEGPLLEALLEVAESVMTYRRRYLSGLQAAPLLDLLLADETNPRSVAFQLVGLSKHVSNLPHDGSLPYRDAEQRIVLRALTAVRLADIHALCQTQNGVRRSLDDLLGNLELELPALCDSIASRHFSHAKASRHLAAWGEEARP